MKFIFWPREKKRNSSIIFESTSMVVKWLSLVHIFAFICIRVHYVHYYKINQM